MSDELLLTQLASERDHVLHAVAELGGPAGPRGSCRADVQATARERGSKKRVGERGLQTARVLASAYPEDEIITAAGTMGADAVLAAGLADGDHPASSRGQRQRSESNGRRDVCCRQRLAAKFSPEPGTDLARRRHVWRGGATVSAT